jgi:hypothetical protein
MGTRPDDQRFAMETLRLLEKLAPVQIPTPVRPKGQPLHRASPLTSCCRRPLLWSECLPPATARVDPSCGLFGLRDCDDVAEPRLLSVGAGVGQEYSEVPVHGCCLNRGLSSPGAWQAAGRRT